MIAGQHCNKRNTIPTAKISLGLPCHFISSTTEVNFNYRREVLTVNGRDRAHQIPKFNCGFFFKASDCMLANVSHDNCAKHLSFIIPAFDNENTRNLVVNLRFAQQASKQAGAGCLP